MKKLANKKGRVLSGDELARIRNSGKLALAAEFGGTFVEDNHCCGDGVASTEFTPEVNEEEGRVFGRDPLHKFVPIEDVPAMSLAGQRWAHFIR